MTQLILIRGIPGSGKSTLAKALLDSYGPSFSVYEADQYYTSADGKYNWDATRVHAAHEWCKSKTLVDLQHGRSAIVSNTFTTLKELDPYFAIAVETGAAVVVYMCQNNWESAHNVPAETMVKMKARFHYDITPLVEKYSSPK